MTVAQRAQVTSAVLSAARAGIKDWNRVPVKYQDSVAACFALKLLSGLGDGSFGGSQTMTRAQACVVLTKLVVPKLQVLRLPQPLRLIRSILTRRPKWTFPRSICPASITGS